ncbi:aromatic ring-opening dioxygenase LigA [Cellulomonas sp. ICMP 17802]|uniref:aromatic ring-opening dioxygenase LigA n=1 Tax=Cellulomonas sp. ICMP 17802 TaxID=3239199 RepID=UPI00351B0EFA
MSTDTVRNNRFVRVAGLLAIIAGAVFLVAGGVTWGAVSSNLKAEKITVSPDAAHFGGALVDTPWEAFAQADIIKHHALTATGGQTYAEVSGQAKALGDKLTADGVSAADQAKDPDLAKLNGLKAVVMNGSFLRASLFTSVVAFGVAALVMGIGVVFGLIGFALRRVAPATEPIAQIAAPADENVLVKA